VRRQTILRQFLVNGSAIVLAGCAVAHPQIVGAALSGTVRDATGTALSGASVTVKQLETGASRQLVTGADGRYAPASVPVGNYTVTASHDGFAAQERTAISLVVAQGLVVNLQLSVDSVRTDVTVEALTTIVNTTSQRTSGLIDERAVKEPPLNGRSYDQLLTLNPATVNYTAERTGGIGTSNSSVGNLFSVSGRRPQDNLSRPTAGMKLRDGRPIMQP
jgi:Carboxypeptidase regulatory-like domain